MRSSVDKPALQPLVDLVHHRWNVPVLAELERRNGAKFVTLGNALQVSRSSLSTSLKNLTELGLIRKNPGHGHPLRPEYLLTEEGQPIAEQCLELHRLLLARNEASMAFRKWSLPLVAAIGPDTRRFNEVRQALPHATSRAVTLGLKSLLGAGWADRRVVGDFPPATGYELLPRGIAVFDRVPVLNG